MTHVLWAGPSEEDGLFTGKRAFGISDCPDGRLYVRCDRYVDGELKGTYHLREVGDRIRWFQHSQGGTMVPISREAFTRFLLRVKSLQDS